VCCPATPARLPRRAAAAVLLVWLLGGCAGASAGPLAAGTPAPHWSGAADLDGDGAPETVSAWFDAAGRRGVLVVTGGAARWTSPLYPAWKVRLADLDGDRAAEVVLGTWSALRRPAGAVAPPARRSLWVLGWDGRALVERWRGSALPRPFEDFEVGPPAAGDAEGAAQVVALERSAAGCARARYRWFGFGFTLVDRAAAPCPAPAAWPGPGPEPSLGTQEDGR
jgi:hypothetical protein